MKSLVVSLIAISLLVTSCNKDEPKPILSYPANRMSATVGGGSFSSDELSAVLTASSVSLSGTANSGTSRASTITLIVNDYVTLATYAIDSNTTARYSDVSGTYDATSGSIAITTYNADRVAGTFSFSATKGSEEKEITGGTFVYYRQ